MDALRHIYGALSGRGGLIISSHYLADIDAVCSAALLSSLFQGSSIRFFDRPSSQARNVCSAYGINYSIFSGDAALPVEDIVLVDTEDPLLIPKHSRPFFAVLDHHEGSKGISSLHRLCDPAAASTTQIVYWMMQSAGVSPSPLQAQLILLGMLSDSYRFKSVPHSRLFSDFASLLPICGKGYDQLLSLVEEPPMAHSERIVFARSFKDYRMYKDHKRKLLFILSDCESFQSLVASRLIECLGVDFALTYAHYRNESRISVRSSPRLTMHLGTFMSELGAALGGTGGGHMHAAGANIPPTEGELIESSAYNLLGKRFSLRDV